MFFFRRLDFNCGSAARKLQFDFLSTSPSGVIKREVPLCRFCKQRERENERQSESSAQLGCALKVSGTSPDSQRRLSSLPADRTYFNPECLPPSSPLLRPLAASSCQSGAYESGPAVESWSLRRGREGDRRKFEFFPNSAGKLR